MKRVAFISHSSADKAVAEKICSFLEANGVPCWIAPRDVTPGKNYGAAILDAIAECSVFVLVLTNQSNKSGQVVREVERAASSNAVIIPFRVEDVQPSRDLEFYVSSTHWLDAVAAPLDKHLHELLRAIRNWHKTDEDNKPGAATPPEAPPPIRSIAAQPGVVPIKLILGILVALLFCLIPGYILLRHKTSATAPLPVTVRALPTATVGPVQRATPNESPSSPALTVEKTTPVGAPSPSTRRRAILHGSPLPEVSPSPSASAPATPVPAPAAPIIGEVTASSEAHFNGDVRKADAAFDGNPGTGWVGKNDGIGESLTVRFKAPAVIESVSMLIAVGQADTFRIRNRVHTLRITFSDGTKQVLTFDDRTRMQRFELLRPITVQWVKFEILSIYPGERMNHTPIFEIAFNRIAENAE